MGGLEEIREGCSGREGKGKVVGEAESCKGKSKESVHG